MGNMEVVEDPGKDDNDGKKSSDIDLVESLSSSKMLSGGLKVGTFEQSLEDADSDFDPDGLAGPVVPLEVRLGERLEKTADEAKMLLRYASMNGVEVPDEVSKEICEADARAVEGRAADAEDEVRFFNAFRELSSLVAPVSVDSLIASEDIYAPERRSLFTRRLVKRSAVKRAAAKFMAITLVILVILLVVQSYWFVGQRILQQFEAATAALHTREFLASRMSESTQEPGGSIFTTGVPSLGASRFSNLNEEELRNVISGYGVALGQWSAWLELVPRPNAAMLSQVTAETTSITASAGNNEAGPGGAPGAAEPDAEGDSFDNFEMEAEVDNAAGIDALPNQAGTSRTYRVMIVGSVLDVIQSFILPLIYGLIGACAYVLRALVTETHQKTYLPEKAGGYMLRLTLGLLAGLGVGYLFKDQITGDSALGALSPLALAFVAGYSVEVLFSVMDRMIPKSANGKTGR